MGSLRRIFVIILIAAAAAATATAADKRARLTINVTAQGSYHTQAKVGRNYADAKFSEAYGIVTYFKAPGDLEVYNTKDPTYGQQMMKRADQARAAALQAQGKTPPKKMSPQEFQAQMQQRQAACKGDQKCLMQLATDASKMMQNVDMSGGQPAAAASDDDEDYDEGTDPQARYLSYFGYDNCGASAYVKVDRTSSGAYDDVQGLVPWSEKEHADYKGDAVQMRLLCNSGSPVLDTKTHDVWGLFLAALSARGSGERVDGGRKQDTGTDVKYGYGLDWVNEQLRSNKPSGTKTITQKMSTPGGGHRDLGTTTGTATITVTWKWDDVAN